MKLPVVPSVDPATDACAGCPAPCCFEHDVEVNGFDLVRLTRGLGLPWNSLVRDVEEPHGLYFGFRLDSGPTHHHFRLLRRESGACQLLLELAGGARRCGVHGLRPGACRIYPLRPDSSTQVGSIVGTHAICPPAQRLLYDDARASLRSIVDEDEAEEELWSRVLARWDLRARSLPSGVKLEMAVLVAWLHAIYGALEPLRSGADRAVWQLLAYARVDEFPLE